MNIIGVVMFPCGHEMEVEFWKTLQKLSAYQNKPIEVTCRTCQPTRRFRWIAPSDGEWREIETRIRPQSESSEPVSKLST